MNLNEIFIVNNFLVLGSYLPSKAILFNNKNKKLFEKYLKNIQNVFFR